MKLSCGAANLHAMNATHRLSTRPAHAPRLLALGGALLWGAVEFVALWRSSWTHSGK